MCEVWLRWRTSARQDTLVPARRGVRENRLDEVIKRLDNIAQALEKIASPSAIEWALAIGAIIAAAAAVVSARAARRAVNKQQETTNQTLQEQRSMNEESLAVQRRVAVLPAIADATGEVMEGLEQLTLDLENVSAQDASPRAGGDPERWARASDSAFELASKVLRLSVLMPSTQHADFLRRFTAYFRKVGLTCAQEVTPQNDQDSTRGLGERVAFIHRQYGSLGVLEGKWTEEAERVVALASRDIELLTHTLIHEGISAAEALDLGLTEDLGNSK